MADFGGTDLDAFRAEAKAWLAENFPAELGAGRAPHTQAHRMARRGTAVSAQS